MQSGLNILIGPNIDIKLLRLAIRGFLVVLILCAQTYRLHAQLQSQKSSVRTVEIYGSAPTMLPSMGGSGVSYLSGVNGLRVNPANVQFNSEKKWTVKLGLLSIAHPNISTTANEKSDLSSWLMTYEPYQPVSASPVNSLPQNQSELNRLFTNSSEPTHFRSSITQELLSVGFHNDQLSIGLYAQYVFKQSFQVNRGWYDKEFYPSPSGLKWSQWLAHNEINYLALGLKYSERLDILSDFTPVSDQFSLGFSPRVIMAGSRSMSRSESAYFSGNNELLESFMIETAGLYSNYLISLHQGNARSTIPIPDIDHRYAASLNDFKDGLGFGMDVGLRYTRNLSNELSLVSKKNAKVARSISVAFSVTDIGYIEYAEGLNLESYELTEAVIEPIDINAAVDKNLPMYNGSPEQYFDFLEANRQLHQLQNNPLVKTKTSVLLPTKAQLGVHLLWNRWSVQTDLQYSLFTTFFSLPGWTYSTGASLQPIKGIIISSGYTQSTNWGNDLSIGLRLAGALVELELSGRWPISKNDRRNLPSSIGFSGFNLRF
tara:strand:+ start:29348 stop:30979 length:1632 start_codon:yes stop_codon:yes gene_type:complete